MIPKKTYEEVQIEIIEFECKDIITTSSLSNEELGKKGQIDYGYGGSTKGFERDV